jgi:adenosine deaminase
MLQYLIVIFGRFFSSFLSSFFPLFSKYIYKLCNDKETIIYTTNCVLRDFQNDGVVYLELRTTPRQIKTAGVSKEEYVKTVLTCISNFNSATMVTKLILSIDRTNTEEEAMEVVDIASKYKDQGIVAVDLCGNPAKGDVSIFRSAYAKAKQHGLKITLHFAEFPPSSTVFELQTLLSYEPDRIGHVILVPDDIKQTIIERKLGLELCLSCNVKFKMTTGSYSDHHFEFWRSTGCPVILCVGMLSSRSHNDTN